MIYSSVDRHTFFKEIVVWVGSKQNMHSPRVQGLCCGVVYIYIYIYTCIYINIYKCKYIYVYIYIYPRLGKLSATMDYRARVGSQDKTHRPSGLAEPQGSQSTQTRGTWDVCITERCSSIKNHTIYIGSVKAITGAFFLEGVLYIKLTRHVSISVFPRMIFT